MSFSFRSPMTCQTRQQPGDAPTVALSTALHKVNANGVLYCKEKIYSAGEKWFIREEYYYRVTSLVCELDEQTVDKGKISR